MNNRRLVLCGALVAVLAVAAVPLAGQAPGAAAADTAAAAATYTPPRTAWGIPTCRAFGGAGRRSISNVRQVRLESF